MKRAPAEPYFSNPVATLYQADARSLPLPDASVQCVVTSPPYWGLRDYGEDTQIGRERTVERYVANLLAVFREVRRVLRPDGTAWLNLGDTYEGKQLVGVPWRVAFALQADGWFLRSAIVWHKPNGMPDSTEDRPVNVHEYVFLLTPGARYYYDHVAVMERATSGAGSRPTGTHRPTKAARAGGQPGAQRNGIGSQTLGADTGTRNLRSVWPIPTRAFKGEHFAPFPPRLPEVCILAGTPARGSCEACGAPYVRVSKRAGSTSRAHLRAFGASNYAIAQPRTQQALDYGGGHDNLRPVTTLGWKPSCPCGAVAAARPAVVLDPFCGSGTTLWVATQHGRHAIGCDVSAKYLSLAAARYLHEFRG